MLGLRKKCTTIAPEKCGRALITDVMVTLKTDINFVAIAGMEMKFLHLVQDAKIKSRQPAEKGLILVAMFVWNALVVTKGKSTLIQRRRG